MFDIWFLGQVLPVKFLLVNSELAMIIRLILLR
jgi:hypothetical protein